MAALLAPPAEAAEGAEGADAPAGSLCEHTEGLLRQAPRPRHKSPSTPVPGRRAPAPPRPRAGPRRRGRPPAATRPSGWVHLSSSIGQTLEGSLSAVSKPNFAANQLPRRCRTGRALSLSAGRGGGSLAAPVLRRRLRGPARRRAALPFYFRLAISDLRQPYGRGNF